MNVILGHEYYQNEKKYAGAMYGTFSGYSQISGFRSLSEWSKNGFEMHFECEFSSFRIQTLAWSQLPPMQYVKGEFNIDCIADFGTEEACTSLIWNKVRRQRGMFLL